MAAIGLLHDDKLAELFLIYVFKMVIPASLFAQHLLGVKVDRESVRNWCHMAATFLTDSLCSGWWSQQSLSSRSLAKMVRM